MDVEALKTEIAAIVARVPTEAARARLADELQILTGRYGAATATADDKKEIESRLAQLRRDAEIAAQVSLWSTFSMVLVGAVVVGFLGGIVLYLRGMRPEPYWTIEATRPIIVFTLLLAMMGFGGLMIVRALFSNDDDARMQTRFRNSREVFLVFSGVFSTVIGFYFGSATGNAATDPPVLAEAAITRSGSDGTVSIAVSKGHAPYEGTIRLAGEDDDRRLAVVGNTLSIRLTPGTECPAGARINVRDAEARSIDQTVAQTAAQLLALGWTSCNPAGQGPATPPAGNGSNGSTENEVNAVG